MTGGDFSTVRATGVGARINGGRGVGTDNGADVGMRIEAAPCVQQHERGRLRRATVMQNQRIVQMRVDERNALRQNGAPGVWQRRWW